MNKTHEELFAQNKNLHLEATQMLNETGLGKILYDAGYKLVGSFVMDTMTWRDLDFERTEEVPNWQNHLEFGKRLFQIPWIWKFDCANNLDKRFPGLPAGFYWGLRGEYPASGTTWKLDLWTARDKEFERDALRQNTWMKKLNDKKRFSILMIKDALCNTPEYGRSILSIHVYEAVLDCNIRTLQEFREWWQVKHGK